MSELHFVQLDFGLIEVLQASSKEEALENVDVDEYQEPLHIGTESDYKEHLEDEDNEVIHL